jgi:PAS domain S-box-containing protein
MTFTAVHPDEIDRVALLHASKLLDTEVSPAFEALVRLAARLTNCPIAAINLIDTHRLWVMAKVGIESRQSSRADAICNTTIQQQQPLLVEDATQDARFHTLPYVAQAPYIHAYAGVPLLIEGCAIGTVCVADYQKRTWTQEDIDSLQDVARSICALMSSELHIRRFKRMESRVRTASLAGSDWLWETDKDGVLQWVSASLMQHTGIDPSTEIGLKGPNLYTPRDDETRASWDRFVQARARREPFSDAIGVRDTPRGKITVSLSGTPVFDANGQFKGYRGASRNVTRQLEAEQEARRADLLLRQAIETFQLSVMISDPQGKVILANKLWMHHMGDAHMPSDPYWTHTLQRLINAGAYPDAAGREAQHLAWRLSLDTQKEPQEVRFKDVWLLLKDEVLPDGSIVHFAMDITQRKHDALLLESQQKALSETQARLSAVLLALPDLWFVIDAQDCIIDGHEAHPMLIRPLAELKALPISHFLPSDLAQLHLSAAQRVRETGEAQQLEYSLPSADGYTRHCEARMTPMPDGQILFVARDITDRRQAEDKLRVSEELYRSVASTISDGLVIVELSGRVVALNPAACRILGIESNALPHLNATQQAGFELLQDDLTQALPPAQWPINEAIATGQRVVNRILPLRRAGGDIVWIQVSSNLLRVTPESAPFAAMATFRDITKERLAVQELAVSEERWKFALEGAGDGVWDWDLNTGRVFYSTRWKSMLGYQDHEIEDAAEEAFNRIHPDEREMARNSLTDYAISGQGIHQLEFRMQHRDGHYLSILSRGKVVSRTHEGFPLRIVGTHSDVTPFKEAERAQREKQTAEAASAAKSEFLSRMSHEIRTPLNAVHGFAQLLQLQMTQGSDTQTDSGQLNYVNQILHASRHLTGLVNDVLDLQQVEAGVLRFMPQELQLVNTIAQCIAMLTPQSEARHIELHSHIDPSLTITADPQRLEQVIMNIGSNAIKYNQMAGEVRFDAHISPDGLIELTITDTGSGMSAEQLSRLFQPFERLGRETGNVEGTGLGLIITRSLVEAMGGHMDIQSQPGAGTRVNVTLPAAPGTRVSTEVSSLAASPVNGSVLDQVMSPQQNSTLAAIPALRVLYVEDNRINAMLFEEALRPFPQIALEIAEDGQSAMAMAQEQAPHVLVLDAHLPGMSGFEVLQALRTLPDLSDVPAFMCSADAMPEDLARAKAAGFAGYWTKPIDIMAVTTELCRLAASSDNAAP